MVLKMKGNKRSGQFWEIHLPIHTHTHTHTHTHIHIYIYIYIYIYILILSNAKSANSGNDSIFGFSICNIHVIQNSKGEFNVK